MRSSLVLKRSLLALGALLIGGVPFSYIVARNRGVDLRSCGNGGVSASRVAEFVGPGPTVVVAALDIGKGLVLGTLARRSDDATAAWFMGGLAVVGHNWSPYLRGAGGRGVLPSLGFLAVEEPIGVGVIVAGLLLGKSVGMAGFGGFASYAALIPAVQKTGRGRTAAAVAIVVPVVAKRILGDRPGARTGGGLGLYVRRLLLDEDEFSWFALAAVRRLRSRGCAPGTRLSSRR